MVPTVMSGKVGAGMPVASDDRAAPALVMNWYVAAGLKSWLTTAGKALRWLPHVVRIYGNAVAGPDHGLGIKPIGHAEARRESLLAGGGPCVPRNTALATDQNIVRREIETGGAVPVVRENRIQRRRGLGAE